MATCIASLAAMDHDVVRSFLDTSILEIPLMESWDVGRLGGFTGAITLVVAGKGRESVGVPVSRYVPY